jgi:Ner family transcriptional regulator
MVVAPTACESSNSAVTNVPVDWHPVDIACALKKRGYSLAGLSRLHGYHPTAIGKALKHRWPAAERIIADALEVDPSAIWPSRYLPTDSYSQRTKRYRRRAPGDKTPSRSVNQGGPSSPFSGT